MQRFLRGLTGWLAALRWSVSMLDKNCREISWLELFWQWVSDTGSLPPVLVDGRWVDLLMSWMWFVVCLVWWCCLLLGGMGFVV